MSHIHSACAYRKIEKPNPRKIQANTEQGDKSGMVKLNKVDEQIIATLKESKELTLQEIAEKTGLPPKKVFRSLRKLFENEMVDTNARKYKLCPDKLNLKAKEDEGEPEVPEE
ncbi:MAG: helix-turn-helix domain-containing protein [Candidatus Bathyarchaeota archaeon]|nr:helix-turn-helix domain-containing protein [Candidatus Bathyarchaeota archaeon]